MSQNPFDIKQISTQTSKQKGQNFNSSPGFMKLFNSSNSLKSQVRAFDTPGKAMRRSPPRLVDALNNVLLNQTNSTRQSIENLEAEEKCQFHPKEQHIAICDETGVFACNKCVFERKIQKPLFMAGFARQTKVKFDEMYNNLLFSITCIEDLNPTLISTKI